MSLVSSDVETHTFRSPVLFTAVGQELPAGAYNFAVEHHEMKTGAGSVKYTICRIHLPDHGPSWSLGVSMQIDYDELQTKLIEDKRLAEVAQSDT
jgi:hypothetical protein